jgi:hypothetical protein
MSNPKSDNLEYKITEQGELNTGDKKIKLLSIRGVPKEYKSFDLLKGSVLEEVNGNRLRIRRDGSSIDIYIHEASDAIYLSKKSTKSNEKMHSLDESEKPLEELVGKTINDVTKKYFSLEDMLKDLPFIVELIVSNSKHCYEISGDDGTIFVRKKPSVRFAISRVLEIVKKEKLTEEDIQELKSIQTELPFQILDERKLKKRNPTLYSRLYG